MRHWGNSVESFSVVLCLTLFSDPAELHDLKEDCLTSVSLCPLSRDSTNKWPDHLEWDHVRTTFEDCVCKVLLIAVRLGLLLIHPVTVRRVKKCVGDLETVNLFAIIPKKPSRLSVSSCGCEDKTWALNFCGSKDWLMFRSCSPGSGLEND